MFSATFSLIIFPLLFCRAHTKIQDIDLEKYRSDMDVALKQQGFEPHSLAEAVFYQLYVLKIGDAVTKEISQNTKNELSRLCTKFEQILNENGANLSGTIKYLRTKLSNVWHDKIRISAPTTEFIHTLQENAAEMLATATDNHQLAAQFENWYEQLISTLSKNAQQVEFRFMREIGNFYRIAKRALHKKKINDPQIYAMLLELSIAELFDILTDDVAENDVEERLIWQQFGGIVPELLNKTA